MNSGLSRKQQDCSEENFKLEIVPQARISPYLEVIV